MRFQNIFYVFFLLLLNCKQVPNVSSLEVPKEYQFKNQIGYVNDFDDVFTVEQENEFERIFTEYNHKTTNEVGVVTVKSIQPFNDINDLNDAILTDWRFGKDDQFNGLIFLIDKDERNLSIRFGSGIQTKLSDSKTQEIIDQVIVPEFKKEDFYNGIMKGFEAIKKELN